MGRKNSNIKNIRIFITVLAIAQIALLLTNIKVSFVVVNTISWWYVFTPIIFFILATLVVFLFIRKLHIN